MIYTKINLQGQEIKQKKHMRIAILAPTTDAIRDSADRRRYCSIYFAGNQAKFLENQPTAGVQDTMVAFIREFTRAAAVF